jgi:ubiquinone/menaquinone biosynthesis C-methylase UbiE
MYRSISPPSGTILDLGAGSVTLARYLPRVSENGSLLISVDYSPNGLVKNKAKARVVANAESLPFKDETLNVIAASCVFEHIENPVPIVAECYRVLKKGGALVFYTPSRRSYVAAIARITPLFFHRLVRMLQTGKAMRDIEVIPTFYRMNTRADLANYFSGFSLVSLETNIGHPSYTTFLPPPIHLIFILFHKIVQRIG